MQAIIYARFSSGSQAQGSSIPRQISTCETEAKRRGWVVEDVVRDDGRSAFSGSNLKHNLGQIEADAAKGLLGGKVLIAERIDRLSRREPLEAANFINQLLKNGLSVCLVADGLYLDASEKLDFGTLIVMVVKAFVSWEESDKKSERLAKSWVKKRRDAEAGKAITRLIPPWLKIEDDAFAVDEERAALVRRMFDMADAGIGSKRIAETFEEEGIDTWTFGKRKAEFRRRTAINKIQKNRAVTGEFQPKSNGQNIGDVIEGYYPQIVTVEHFERVQAGMSARKSVALNESKGGDIINLLPMAKVFCETCGSKMKHKISRRSGAKITLKDGRVIRKKSTESHYRCGARTENKEACSNGRTIAYHSFEKALLEAVLHIALDSSAFRDDERANALHVKLSEAKRTLENLDAKARRLASALGDDELSVSIMNEAIAEANAARAMVQALEIELKDAKGEVSPVRHLERVQMVADDLKSEDDEKRRRQGVS